MNTQQKKLGLALGGGGSRALCHLGVILALNKAGITIDAIAGNSMGALIGAVYAHCLDAEKTRELVAQFFTKSSVFGGRNKGDGLERGDGWLIYCKRCLRSLAISLVLSFRKGFIRGNPCKNAIAKLLPNINIRDLKIPFASVALNLTDGVLETFTDGELQKIIYAGTNIGVVFAPFKWNGKSYIDAAPICSVPAIQARNLGVDCVLAVDLRTSLPENYTIQNGLDVIMRLEQIESNIINEQITSTADLIIRPQVSGVFWGDFSRSAEIISAGEIATNAIIPELQKRLC